MAFTFNGTTPNLNYAVNQLNKNQNTLSKLIASINAIIEKIQNVIGGIITGGGSEASNDKVEAAVQWAINKATNNYITYSQSNRNLKNPDGMSFDCSSFIITAFYAVGIDIDATYTGDMRAGFTAKGWIWIPGQNFPASQLQRGDILLNESIHTQMYIGDNQDVNCGSTPAKVQSHAANNYGRGWNGILRFSE